MHVDGLHWLNTIESLLERARLATNAPVGTADDSNDTQLLLLPEKQWGGSWQSCGKPLRPPCELEATVLAPWQQTGNSKVPRSDAEQGLLAKGLAGGAGSASWPCPRGGHALGGGASLPTPPHLPRPPTCCRCGAAAVLPSCLRCAGSRSYVFGD